MVASPAPLPSGERGADGLEVFLPLLIYLCDGASFVDCCLGMFF